MCKVSVIVPVYNVENYIRDMLLSVQNQTFKDFEVILINDGSPDNSQSIIEEFCGADKRFKCFEQPNGGVAAARNNGISKAKGDYLVFYDPDDYIPPRALEKMYKVASSNKADMVIGIMEEKSLGESLIYLHSQALAKQDRIDPMDVHFTGAWSLCHKMFKRSLIVDNDIKFEKLTNAEDGVFTYCCLNHAERIFGARVIAYNYMKRPFWLEASATQTISSKYLEGLLASHNRILEEATKLADKHLDGTAREKYLQHLFIRFIEGEMIKGYYRNIWRADEDIISRISERTDYYRQFITDKQWNEILSRHKDLQLDKGYMMPELLAQIPTVSIILSADLPEDKLELVLGSIYNQQFQRFEVLISDKYEGIIGEAYLRRPNFHLVEEADFNCTVLDKAKGRYIAVIDEFVIYTKNTLLNMVNKLEAGKQLDFVAMLMKSYDGSEYREIPCLSAAYGYTKSSRKRNNKLCAYDSLLANKLFRKSVIEESFLIADSRVTCEKLFSALNFERIRKGTMITYLTEEEIIERAEIKPSAAYVNIHYAVNDSIKKTMGFLRRYINRNDISNFKRKLKL